MYNLLSIYPLLWESFLVDYKSIRFQQVVIPQKLLGSELEYIFKSEVLETFHAEKSLEIAAFPPILFCSVKARIWLCKKTWVRKKIVWKLHLKNSSDAI